MLYVPRSRSLWNLASGILYFLLALAWFRMNKTLDKPKSRVLKFLLLIMAVLGVLFSVLGIPSIVGGLGNSNRECRVLIMPCPTQRATDPRQPRGRVRRGCRGGSRRVFRQFV